MDVQLLLSRSHKPVYRCSVIVYITILNTRDTQKVAPQIKRSHKIQFLLFYVLQMFLSLNKVAHAKTKRYQQLEINK